MSNEARDFVLASKTTKGSSRLVLLALAQFADEQGVAMPGVDRIADYANMTTRNAQLLLHKLRDEGVITIAENQGLRTRTGWTNRYAIVGMDGATRGEKIGTQGVKSGDQGVKNPVARGEKLCTQGVKSVSPKPSVKPSEESTTIDPPLSPAFETIRKRLKLTRRQIAAMPPGILTMSEADERACHAFLNSGKGNGLLITMLTSGDIPDLHAQQPARASPPVLAGPTPLAKRAKAAILGDRHDM